MVEEDRERRFVPESGCAGVIAVVAGLSHLLGIVGDLWTGNTVLQSLE